MKKPEIKGGAENGAATQYLVQGRCKQIASPFWSFAGVMNDHAMLHAPPFFTKKKNYFYLFFDTKERISIEQDRNN